MPIESSVRNFSKTYEQVTITTQVNVVSGHVLSSSTVRQTVNSWSGSDTKSRTTSTNPQYADQIRKHQNATTTFVASRDHVEFGSGSTYSYTVTKVGDIRTFTTVTCTGYLPCSPALVGINPAVLTRATDDARGKILKKIAQVQTPFTGGVFLGELRETLHMIKHPADGLVKLILGEQFMSTKRIMRRASLRKRRPLHGEALKRSYSKAAADAWLENAFGWQPFLSDIKSGMEAYNRHLNYIEYVPVRATGRDKVQLSAAREGGGSVGGFVEYWNQSFKTQESEVYVYGVVRNVPNGIRANTGITWGQFVPTLWELLPFSFLADYFSNIGDILSACSVDLGSVAWLSSTSVNKGVHKLTFQEFRSIAGTGPEVAIGSGSHSPVTRINKVVSRTPVFIAYPPALRFEFPFSSRKWANMGALIVSQYKGGISSSLRK